MKVHCETGSFECNLCSRQFKTKVISVEYHKVTKFLETRIFRYNAIRYFVKKMQME